MVLFTRGTIFSLSGITLCVVITLALVLTNRPNTLCIQSNSQPHSVATQQHFHRKLHFLLPINAKSGRQSARFCKVVLSALLHGYEPTIINWDLDRDWQSMQRLKITGVHEYLRNITDENADTDMVLMVDAFDVWMQVSPKTIIGRYDELGTSGVVVGAERVCFPNGAACELVPISPLASKGAYQGFGGEPRWANSGTIMGSVAAMRTLYNDLAAELEKPEWSINQGDQGLFNEYLAAGRISVDYRSRLFWSTAFANALGTAHFINSPYHIDDLIPHELYPPLLYHGPTGQMPAVVHLNGPDKPLLEEWWGKLWWQKLDDGHERFRDIVSSRVDGAMVTFAGVGRKDWRENCPKEVVGF